MAWVRVAWHRIRLHVVINHVHVSDDHGTMRGYRTYCATCGVGL